MLTRSIRRSSQCWMQHGKMEIGQEVVDACLVNDWSLQCFYTSVAHRMLSKDPSRHPGFGDAGESGKRDGAKHVIGLLTGSLETKVGFMVEHPVSGSGLTDLETQKEGLVGLAEIL
ncbi:hypothetical protein GE21DRAFT_283 [Neurospora crassa]|uniref:Uncharacterized protein n=1 Tax=Neurospora crassa (strain ATCC 24698 / 74-OR23-1A / CBS 708.71 / DSM 1257 / FGSC 987) TaxID=367110 RepID=Q7SE32_NEUCR|nr:hypothetical protein NCU02144 [Neurospora crassa OR74A]EAA35066.1 hypothetical protein NCU02144 [Neurospora crassa OR74A]KHE83947.1 hypothetical protein GE21DRAFT_283 [Neurospora crassa]|eukprot:XP_964302.1 hypothetical protein NCU02144 [Neurospora crassa OR74A]